MAATAFKTVDEYLATFPESTQHVLRQVRRAIREAVPEAEELIGYQIPAYRLHGWLIYFAGFKKHYSLFCPRPGSLLETFKAQLSPYEIHRSTIKFPLNQPVPFDLISSMAKHCAAEHLAQARSNQPKKP